MHRTTAELEALLPQILAAPSDEGVVRLIVARPSEDERKVLDNGELDLDVGLVGDHWLERGNPYTPDGSADLLAQVTVMNARVADAVAGDVDRWPEAGDQIYLDLDLSKDNLPAGTRLSIGEAVIEISAKPHTGCSKFSARFGPEALRFVNIGVGRANRFRGLNASVVTPGSFAVGDVVTKA